MVDASITFATNNGDMGGGEVMLFNMAVAARKLGVDVAVVAPSCPGQVLEAAHDKGFRTIEISAHDRLSWMRGLRQWDAACRQGVLWCNGLVPSFATAGHPDRVVHLHQWPHGLQRGAYFLSRLKASKVLVPSQYMASQLRGTEVMENWTHPVRVLRGPRSQTEPVIVGFLGRHSPDKGLPVLAEALAILEGRTPGRYRLLLAGEPRFVTESARRQVEAALRPVSAIVDRPGWMSREEFFSRADLAVFPSVWAEPFGLVVAEAMSARVPFVISDAGALPEVAGTDHPLIAEHGNPVSLAAAIEQAASSYDPSVVAAAFDRWKQLFSPDAGRERSGAVLADLGVLPNDTAHHD